MENNEILQKNVFGKNAHRKICCITYFMQTSLPSFDEHFICALHLAYYFRVLEDIINCISLTRQYKS